MSHNPTEHVQEEIQHHASHDRHGEPGGQQGQEHQDSGKWITAAATTAAIVAALAAGAGALATRHETQSTLIRIKANDNWNYYQAKSIKASLLDAKIYSAQLSKVEPRKADLDKQAEYAETMPEVQNLARELEKLSTEHLETHETYEIAATLFHIAIAIVAVSVVARRKEFWYFSMVVSTIGVVFFAKAMLTAPAAFKDEGSAPAAKHVAEHETSASGTKGTGEHSAEKPPATASKATKE